MKRWLDFDESRNLDNVLIIASVELRCAIERLAFELLYIVKDCTLSAEDEKRCRGIKGTLELLEESEPKYRQRAVFTNLAFSFYPNAPRISVIDIRFLKRKWHEISEYCHCHLRPEESWDSAGRKFQSNGFNLLQETYEQIVEWLTKGNALGIADRKSMEPEVREIYEKFLSDELDESQAKIQLELAQPVLASRFKRKRMR